MSTSTTTNTAPANAPGATLTPTPADPAILAANLAAVRTKQPEVAAMLAATAPAAVQWLQTTEGLSAVYQGRALASKRQPITEAKAVAATLDPLKHTCAAVMGLGLGYHVRALIARQAEGDACLIFEPDPALLRAVLERINYADLLDGKGLYLLTDPANDSELASAAVSLTRAMAGGVKVIDHAPSLVRLAPHRARLASQLAAATSAVRLNAVSELTQTEATFRNVLFNIDYYATCQPLEPLTGALAGRVAITVAAGPSLGRNIDQLARPGVRERCVIIAAQTVLKPLLARGIRPHFVTALDHHEVSARFYEGLTREQLEGVTLVCEAKVNPAVTAAFMGRTVMPADFLLDRVLAAGGGKREMGKVSSGTTVAHLSYYLARTLGCQVVALVGQDLGFTDGQYYAGGAAIHRVWAGELGEFNTLEMLEWQRIKRMGPSLRHATDQLGRPVYTDEQMNGYLQQFLRDFLGDSARGLTTIDATEGGVRKDHTTPRPLASVIDDALASADSSGPSTDEIIERCLGPQSLAAHPATPTRTASTASSAAPPTATATGQHKVHKPHPGLAAARAGLLALRDGLAQITALAKRAQGLLMACQARPDDAALATRTVTELGVMRDRIVAIEPAWFLINVFNITAAFRRWKADRALALSAGLPPREVQARQLDRDLVNVRLLQEACERLDQLSRGSLAMLDGGPRQTRDLPRPVNDQLASDPEASPARRSPHAGAITPSTPHLAGEVVRVTRSSARVLAATHVSLTHDWLGRDHRDRTPPAAVTLHGQPAIRLAVGRLLRTPGLDGVALSTDHPDQLRALLGPHATDTRVSVSATPESVASDTSQRNHLNARPAHTGPTHSWPTRTIAAARLFNRSCWRGGLANLSCYDEQLNPALLAATLAATNATMNADAALIFGPSWALIDPAITASIIERHRDDPEHHRLVFSQAGPGLAPCLLARASIEQLAELRPEAGVLASIGGLTGYLPASPRPDDLGRSPCVTISPAARDALHRCVVDGPVSGAWLEAALDAAGLHAATATSEQISGAIALRSAAVGLPSPWHLRLHLPASNNAGPPFEAAALIGPAGRYRAQALSRASEHLASAAAGCDALAVTISCDPSRLDVLLELVSLARQHGALAVHVRTLLMLSAAQAQTLASSLPLIDALSLDIPSMLPATLEALGHAPHGRGQTLHEQMASAWRTLHEATVPTPGVKGLRSPWLVPRLTRRDEVYAELEGFYDHWLSAQGACVLDALPSPVAGARIAPLPRPELALVREARESLRVNLEAPACPDGANP